MIRITHHEKKNTYKLWHCIISEWLSSKLTVLSPDDILHQWQGTVIIQRLLGCVLIKHIFKCVLGLPSEAIFHGMGILESRNQENETCYCQMSYSDTLKWISLKDDFARGSLGWLWQRVGQRVSYPRHKRAHNWYLAAMAAMQFALILYLMI